MTSSLSTALILYTPPLSAEAFLKQESQRAMKDLVMKQVAISLFQRMEDARLQEAFPTECVIVASQDVPAVVGYAFKHTILLGGYERENKIAFMIHLANSRELEAASESIVRVFDRFKKKPIGVIDLHMRRGYAGACKGIMASVERWMKMGALPVRMLTIDPIVTDPEIKGVGLKIEVATGNVSAYNPIHNTMRRQLLPIDKIKSNLSKTGPAFLMMLQFP
jgi:hypothetical protein